MAAGAAFLVVLCSALLAHEVKLGVALIGALVFVPIAFLNPPLALAVWATSAFMTAIPAFGQASNRSLYLLFIVWVGTLFARDDALRRRARRQIPMLGGLVLFFVWALSTLLWAPEPGSAKEPAINFLLSMGVFLLVTTFVLDRRHARWLVMAYVMGTTLSVLAGAATGGLSTGASELNTATSVEGRLQGGVSDPNYLAAACVPAIVLAAGLAARRGQVLLRFALGVAVVILTIGLAATESRGGILAAAVVAIGALLTWKGQRKNVALIIALVLLAGAGWFTASPASWERVTASQDGGSGRTDVWTVAWRVVKAHPIEGVGLANFSAVSPDYLRQPGALSRADLIVDQKIMVHNAYLQLWAETGAIGLLLLLLLAGRAVSSGYRAADLFERRGDQPTAALARAGALALLGALAASFFLSNLDDRRIWILMALGPVLFAIARADEPVK
ncbi:MAG TPA: O-antigen ligase family protein [Baekduia sp.]|nr:O-antigen ligase family protein [Baekduia sp.]